MNQSWTFDHLNMKKLFLPRSSLEREMNILERHLHIDIPGIDDSNK